ncbi:sigma 54-interacting transcriptional regulator [Desulfobacula sp.]|uniref:sigma-54-dependent Fis family transcriptional regulator n=1 Tax=Desulfobacula sp. TaxID=2593537 RepID=UPI0026377ECD|nr:sigma 54-interacting transcriptional regulator [Desulfobacula sp.]
MSFDEKDFFREATLKICGSLDIERALQQCLLYVCEFIPVGHMGFHVYHRDTGVVETVALATPEHSEATSMKTQLSAKGRKQVQEQRSRRVRIVDRLGDDPVTSSFAQKLNASDLSAVVMDLVLEKKMLGVFSIFNNGEQNFTSDHVRLLSLLTKPCAIALTNSVRYRELKNLKDLLTDDNRYFQDELCRITGEDVIGADLGLKSVMEMVRQVAPLESPVLLLGETGTGKEVIANAIHNLSLRRDGPFIRVNCGAIPTTLLDSELFGYEKGAFTGAVSQKRGRIERAHGGTLFLDEIGELTPEAQIRLLRVLQEKEIDRVGGTQTIRVNIRVIAATHRNLEKMMETNRFRADLFFRLRVFPVTIPPLREHTVDIPALVHHFIKKKSKEMKRLIVPAPTPSAIDRLMAYHWPGNIRELENAVERSLILDQGDLLEFKEIGMHQPVETKTDNISADELPVESLELNAAMSRHIRCVLDLCNGRVEGEKGAAKVLNIHPSTLRKRMKKLKIPFGKTA